MRMAAVSDETAMREALPDDWISLIGMAKFARAASGSIASIGVSMNPGATALKRY